MLRRILAWLGRSDDGTDGEAADEPDDSRFVPSELDASVREAHGGGQAEAERELASLQAKAELLEDRERER